MKDIELSAGTIRYSDSGEGPPVVFLHGFLLNSTTWRGVTPTLMAAGHRCIAPDLPLGGHSIAMPDADLSVDGVADIVTELLERLDLEDVTLVANDSGGVIAQTILARHNHRVARAVLVTVDAYDHFPPPRIKPFLAAGRAPGGMRVFLELLRSRTMRRATFAMAKLSEHPLPDDVLQGYLTPSQDNPAIRADMKRFIADVVPDRTQALARKFGDIDVPVLVIWSREDRTLPLRLGERMVADLPNASLRVIDGCRVLVQEDQPDQLADAVVEFLAKHVAA